MVVVTHKSQILMPDSRKYSVGDSWGENEDEDDDADHELMRITRLMLIIVICGSCCC